MASAAPGAADPTLGRSCAPAAIGSVHARAAELTGGAAPAEVAVVAGIVQSYLDRLPGRIRDITEALDSGDAATLAAGAHSLKGASLSLGADRLGQTCARLEELAEAGDLESAGLRVDALSAAVAADGADLRDCLQTLRRRAATAPTRGAD